MQFHAFAPLPCTAQSQHYPSSTKVILFKGKFITLLTPKNKKESKGKWLAIGLQG